MPPLPPWMELNFWQVLSLLHPPKFRGGEIWQDLSLLHPPWPSAWDFMSVCGRPDTKVLFLEECATTKMAGRKEVALLGTAGADHGHLRPLRRGCWRQPGFLGHTQPSCLWEGRESQPAAGHWGFSCPVSQQSGSNLETSLFPTPTTPHPLSSCSK